MCLWQQKHGVVVLEGKKNDQKTTFGPEVITVSFQIHYFLSCQILVFILWCLRLNVFFFRDKPKKYLALDFSKSEQYITHVSLECCSQVSAAPLFPHNLKRDSRKNSESYYGASQTLNPLNIYVINCLMSRFAQYLISTPSTNSQVKNRRKHFREYLGSLINKKWWPLV